MAWAHYMEMRLGKTPTALNEFSLLRKYQGVSKVVILSPNSYKRDWYNEIPKFGVAIPRLAYDTSDRKGNEKFLAENRDEYIIIVNYEGLIYEHTQKFLKNALGKHSMLIIDESIKIKNPQALSTSAAVDASLRADWIRLLSGLPMTQGPHDLFSQMRVMRAVPGSNFYSFRNTFCKMGGFKNKKVKGTLNEKALQNLMRNNSFVAKRKEWTKTTEPEYYVVSIELSEEQRKHYNEMNQDFVTELESGKTVSASQAVTQMMKLQQISSGFMYDENGEAVDIMPPEKTSKMRQLVSLLEDEIEGKLVVPFHYSKSGEALLKSLSAYNPAVIWSQERMKEMGTTAVEQKHKFNNGVDGCRVMLLQISAGKYGHDLSGIAGDRTTYMAFYENTWSLDDRIQIEARITVGDNQDWPTVYLDFVSSGVELKPIKALQAKEKVVEAIFGAFKDNKSYDYDKYNFKTAKK